MRFVISIYFPTILFLCLFTSLFAQNVKRSRNEGTVNISPSNVAGNGNITSTLSFESNYGGLGFYFEPRIQLSAGISDILELKAAASLINFKRLGTTEAHLQITTPGNNALRFFGIALSGDLFLSTTSDTITGGAAASKPEYNSYIRPSLILDIDWIAKFKQLHLKTYLLLNMVDNPDILFLYDQLSLTMGFEWKMYHNSFLLDAGASFYKEKKTTRHSGDDKFEQGKLWIEPGVRLRFLKRFSFLGSIRVVVLQMVKTRNPLPAEHVRLSTILEVPIILKETNTEAIRSLIFLEQIEAIEKDRITRSIDQNKKIKTDFETGFDDLQIDESSESQEKEYLRKREEIQQKMEEIEKLLEDLE
jgi:hypothetical protein